MRQKAGQLMAFDPSTPDREAQKAPQVRHADKRLSCQKLGVRACRPVEHPCWNFQPTICLRPIQRAAKNDITSLVDGPMNANSATKPRMMSIKNLAKNGPVGVLKPCCTMAAVRTRALTTRTPDQAYFDLPAAPRGSLTPAEAPLIDAENLFRQPGPVLNSRTSLRSGRS